MKILHISTECYPAAKAGGMGDVVGALPIYQGRLGARADVIIPKYGIPWMKEHPFHTVFISEMEMEGRRYYYALQKLAGSILPFDLYVVDIPELYDRNSVYLAEDGEGFADEPERNMAFQRAACDFALRAKEQYDILHCHDHQSGLIPFMLRYVEDYKAIQNTPTFFTIHNGQYRGVWGWERIGLLPVFDGELGGMLEWDGNIHAQASAIKCAWGISTVSPTYMQELADSDEQLRWLYQNETDKCQGILNGVDYDVWNPSDDPMLHSRLKKSWPAFKQKNKAQLCEAHGLDASRPLFSFIGRLAYQKGADLLPHAIGEILETHPETSFLILGSGDKGLERQLRKLAEDYPGRVAAIIAYDEGLAHRIYAGSDFLLMPSRFEPCGLNQLLAMRYGTIPVVRRTGGLADTVPDIGDDGNGIAFDQPHSEDIQHAIARALELYENKPHLQSLREKVADLDFSWEHSAKVYLEYYQEMSTGFIDEELKPSRQRPNG